jgi:hypothetical protein
MTRAEVVATVPSDFNSFKIANIGDPVGTFEQDRTSAIVGRLGATPPMIPVELTLRKRNQEERYHFEIFQHPKLSPLLLNITLFNGLLNSVQSGAEVTYRVSGRMGVAGHDDVVLDDMFSPTDSLFPDAFFVVNSVGRAPPTACFPMLSSWSTALAAASAGCSPTPSRSHGSRASA